jgi:hypothetical protein
MIELKAGDKVKFKTFDDQEKVGKVYRSITG